MTYIKKGIPITINREPCVLKALVFSRFGYKNKALISYTNYELTIGKRARHKTLIIDQSIMLNMIAIFSKFIIDQDSEPIKHLLGNVIALPPKALMADAIIFLRDIKKFDTELEGHWLYAL